MNNYPFDHALLHTLVGHKYGIGTVAIRGNLIASSSDRIVIVWDRNSGQRIRTLEKHTSIVRSVAIEGDIVASGSDDNLVIVENIKTGKHLYTLKTHSDSVQAVAIQNNTLVSASLDGTVKVSDLKTGKLIRTLKDPDIDRQWYCVAINGDVVAAGTMYSMVYIWNWRTGKKINRFSVFPSGLNRIVAIALQDNIMVCGTVNERIAVINLETNAFIRTFENFGPPSFTIQQLDSIAIHNDIIIAGVSTGVYIWNYVTGELLDVISGVSSVAAIDGDTLVTGSRDTTVKVWRLINKQDAAMTAMLALTRHGDTMYRPPLFHGIAERIVNAIPEMGYTMRRRPRPQDILQPGWLNGDDQIVRDQLDGDEPRDRKRGRTELDEDVDEANDDVLDEANADDGPLVPVGKRRGLNGDDFGNGSDDNDFGGNDGGQQFGFGKRRQLGGSKYDHVLSHTLLTQAHVLSVAMHNNTIVGGTQDGVVNVWNADTGEHMQTLNHRPFDNGYVQAENVAINENFIVCGSSEFVTVWNRQGNYLYRLQIDCLSLAIDDNKRLVIGTNEGVVYMYDTPTGKIRDKFEIGKPMLKLAKGYRLEDPVTAVAIQNNFIATGSWETMTVRVWNINTHNVFIADRIHKHPITAIAIHNDIVVSGSQGVIVIWNFKTDEVIATIEATDNMIVFNKLVIHNNMIIGGGWYGIRIWDLETGHLLHTINFEDKNINSVAVQGNFIVGSLFRSNEIFVWKLIDKEKAAMTAMLALTQPGNNIKPPPLLRDLARRIINDTPNRWITRRDGGVQSGWLDNSNDANNDLDDDHDVIENLESLKRDLVDDDELPANNNNINETTFKKRHF